MAKFKNWEYDVTFLYEGELLLIPFQRRRSAACHEVMQLSSQRARHFMFPHPLLLRRAAHQETACHE